MKKARQTKVSKLEKIQGVVSLLRSYKGVELCWHKGAPFVIAMDRPGQWFACTDGTEMCMDGIFRRTCLMSPWFYGRSKRHLLQEIRKHDKIVEDI